MRNGHSAKSFGQRFGERFAVSAQNPYVQYPTRQQEPYLPLTSHYGSKKLLNNIVLFLFIGACDDTTKAAKAMLISRVQRDICVRHTNRLITNSHSTIGIHICGDGDMPIIYMKIETSVSRQCLDLTSWLS